MWKKEKLHCTINKYIETLTFTRLQALCSQLVTFKMLNSSPRFGVDHHFLYDFSFLPRAWILPRIIASSANLVRSPGRPISFHWRNLWGWYWREGVYICWSLFLVMSLWWSPDVFDTVTTEGPMINHLLRLHKIPKWKVPFVEGTYFLEQTCYVISNFFISFFKHTLLSCHVSYIFYDVAIVFPSTFFLFLQHVFIPNVFWCCRLQHIFVTYRYGFKVHSLQHYMQEIYLNSNKFADSYVAKFECIDK